MRLVVLIICLLVATGANAQVIQQVETRSGKLIKRVPSLRNLRPDTRHNPPATRNLEGLIFKKKWKDDPTDYGSPAARDTVVQTKKMPRTGLENILQRVEEKKSKITSNHEGIGFTSVAPADPCLAVGPAHIVQMINGSQGAYLQVWDKQGNALVDQRYMFQLTGSPDYHGFGDPIVLYDQFSDRFMISEFGSDSCSNCYANSLVIGISQTGDPTAGWYFYKFNTGNFFVDYPHYAVWPNALYATSNDYNTNGTAYLGSSVYAFDKQRMLNGDASAGFQRFRLSSTQYNKFISLAPVSISGTTPPPVNQPGLFMYFHDDNRTATSSDADSIGILSLHTDFITPSNSVVQHQASLAVSPFKSRICNGSRNCIPSAAGTGYDDISDRFMNKIYYRNFGTHQSMVATHTVDATYPQVPAISGLRWYELRLAGGNWNVYQQGTYAPDNNSRWMGAININASGQIGLMYNLSGPARYASIYYTGRNQSDPLGQMLYDDGLIKDGDALGTFSNRWGDYNDLVLDPADDSLFWCTAMYGSSTWKTRIASFKLLKLPELDLTMVGVNNYINGHSQCEDLIRPSITVRNSGTNVIETFVVHAQLNGLVISEKSWTGTMAYRDTAQVHFDPIEVSGGAQDLRIFVAAVNGVTDSDPLNDTTQLAFSILRAEPGIVEQDFGGDFPPEGWKVINENPGSMTWEKSANTGPGGNGSAVMRLFDYSDIGHRDVLLSPVMDVSGSDSLILNFDLAYKLYGQSASYSDSLEIVLSTDCGNSFSTVWKKGGADLATSAGYFTSQFVPSINDWSRIRVDLTPYVANPSSVSIGFRTVNRFGQNLYIDNIQVEPKNVKLTDAAIAGVRQPGAEICDNLIQPVVEIANAGSDTIRSLRISYNTNGGNLLHYNWQGSLAPGAREVLQDLEAISVTASGYYQLKIFTSLPNGLADQNTTNDTTTQLVHYVARVPLPIRQGFESGAFPPAGWHTSSSGSAYTWERNGVAFSDNPGSAWIRNFRFNSNRLADDLVSPIFTPQTYDSFYVKFDLAHAMTSALGAKDTLELLLSSACGTIERSIFRKGGHQLSTINNPVTYPANDSTGFVPTMRSNWRTESHEISSMLMPGQEYRIILRNYSSGDNNTFVDNIHIYGVILPARLKEQGYLISPNPADGQIVVQHLRQPVTLRSIQLSNQLGQLVAERRFSTAAPVSIAVDLSSLAPGIYQVRLVYSDKIITERIVKK